MILDDTKQIKCHREVIGRQCTRSPIFVPQVAPWLRGAFGSSMIILQLVMEQTYCNLE